MFPLTLLSVCLSMQHLQPCFSISVTAQSPQPCSTGLACNLRVGVRVWGMRWRGWGPRAVILPSEGLSHNILPVHRAQNSTGQSGFPPRTGFPLCGGLFPRIAMSLQDGRGSPSPGHHTCLGKLEGNHRLFSPPSQPLSLTPSDTSPIWSASLTATCCPVFLQNGSI